MWGSASYSRRHIVMVVIVFINKWKTSNVIDHTQKPYFRTKRVYLLGKVSYKASVSFRRLTPKMFVTVVITGEGGTSQARTRQYTTSKTNK